MKKNRNLMGSGFLKLVPVWLRTMKLLPLVLIVGLMQLSLIAFSQQQGQRTISGRVTDTKGEALPGVTVLLQGTTNGTLTNADGRYSLPGVPDKGVIVFTFVGMAPQQIDIQNKATIDVVMEVETIALDELVVVGYGVQKRVTLTGSTAVIKNADLVASPTPTASQAIAGKVPGIMTRMPDGRPGNASALQIRNMGTPLYVIDGNQTNEDGFNNLDMNDIDRKSVV
jgi:hypothetical protein